MWTQFWTLVFPSAVLTAAVGSLIQILIQHRLNLHIQKLRFSFDEKLAALQATLTRMRDREQTILATLQPRRAERISEFAIAVSEFVDAVNCFVGRNPLVDEEEARKQRTSTYENVRASLKRVWLLLPHPQAAAIRKFIIDALDYSNEAEINRGMMKSDPRMEPVVHKKGEELWAIYRSDIFPRHQAIEEQFRKFLGVEPMEELPTEPA